MKLNTDKVQWIIRQKQEGQMTNTQIAGSMKVGVRWVQKLWGWHKNASTG